MIRYLVNKASVVFTFSVLIVIAGTLSYIRLPRESAPEIEQPYVFVTTLYPGVSARDIESLVTRVIEDEVGGLDGLLEITSASQQSVSFIYTKFSSGISVEEALRKVQERVNRASAKLPADIEEPQVQELSSSSFPVFIVALSHPDGLEVIDRAAEDLYDEIERIQGVLDVELAGNLVREVSIELDPIKLAYYGLSIDDVSGAIRNSNVSIPGGLLKSSTRNYSIEVNSEIKDPDQFRSVEVESGSVKVPLEQLGEVRFRYAEQQAYSRFNGEPAITFTVTKRSGENIIAMVDRVRDLLERSASSLPAGSKIHYVYDESDYIRQIIADLENNMFTGFLLVLVVTVFALGPLNSLFVSMAIPFSMLLSFFVLELLGVTLNMVVLFSLILALGMLVDNGIVIVENIYRHRTMGKSRRQAAIDGPNEVALPIVTSTLTTCLAFFPIIYMPDIMGDFMKYVPITVIVVLLASLLVALTINPVFTSRFLRAAHDNPDRPTIASRVNVCVQCWYERRLQSATRHALPVLAVSFLVVILGFVLFGMFGREPIFFPQPDPQEAIVTVEMPQGTPLEETDRIVRQVEGLALDVPSSLKNVQSVAGRGGEADVFSGIGEEYHVGYVRLSFKPFTEREIKGRSTIDSLEQRLKSFAGARVDVIEQEGGPPSGNDISYEFVGDDYALLGTFADSAVSILSRYPQLELVDTDYEPARPRVAVSIDRLKASDRGLSVRDIAATVRTAMSGNTVGQLRLTEDEYDIVVRYLDKYRASIDDLRRLHVVDRDGNRVPLVEVADFGVDASVGAIKRRDLRRAVGVWADFRPGAQGKSRVRQEIDSLVRSFEMPQGYRIEAGAGLEVREEATQFLFRAFLIALFLIALVLVSQFNSVGQPFIILLSVFLSLGGVFWGYLLTGQAFVVIMSGIGCIALAGVAVNNCIVLVDYTNKLIAGGKPYDAAIIEAGKTRLRPVLLTAVTTVLGLLPMAFGVSIDIHPATFGVQLGSEMSEFWTAFAWAIVFGLTFATIMTLVMVPAMLHVYFAWFPPKPQAAA